MTYQSMFKDKDARHEFLSQYEDDIAIMVDYGFIEMARSHKKNLKRFSLEFAEFD